MALALSPIVVGAVSLIGDTWYPVGDWASMLYRTSQVGTRDTPLIGTYTVKGYAHPGPFLYWAAAPLYRLTGGEPRSLEWTAAIVNSAAIVAIAAVLWRRGRLPLLVGGMLLVTLLIRGIGPSRLVDLWNPFLGLLPFLLVVLLAWDAALGRRRSLALAAIPASIAIQCHVAFGALAVLVALWLLAWMRWWPRLVPRVAGVPGVAAPELPRPPWRSWRAAARTGLIIGVVLWLPPLVDLVFDTHNLASVLGHLLVGSGTQIGLTYGGSLVSRYVRPDGPWMGGEEPSHFFAVQGSGAVPALLIIALLVGCLVIARRRGLADVAALASLSLVLVVGSIPAAANIVVPAFDYLVQWLKIVGGMVWFTVGWTAWRLVEPAVRAAPARRAGFALAGLALLATTAWSWGEAAEVETAAPFETRVVQELRAQVAEELPRDATYRVESQGDDIGHNAAGLTYYMIEDGFDLVTRDGEKGLKWGHAYRMEAGDRYDLRLTVAVHYGGNWIDHYRACAEDPDVELVASYDHLTPGERYELERLEAEGFLSPETFSPADRRRAGELEVNGFRVGVFAGDSECKAPPFDNAD